MNETKKAGQDLVTKLALGEEITPEQREWLTSPAVLKKLGGFAAHTLDDLVAGEAAKLAAAGKGPNRPRVLVLTIAEEVVLGKHATAATQEAIIETEALGYELGHMTSVYAEALGMNKVAHTLLFRRAD
jgi:hypothetical protein